MKIALKLIMLGYLTWTLSSCSEECRDCGPESSKIIDGSGNEYSFVTIGSQDWLDENLKTTKYRDGNDIPLVVDSAEWASLDKPAYCWYENEEVKYGKSYGNLYNWYTVETKKLCPTGWHVATDDEWSILTEYLGGTNIAGGKLKEADTTHWHSPNTGATDEFGFSSLPGGQRFVDDETVAFYGIRSHTGWWSSTERSSQYSMVRWSNFRTGFLWRFSNPKKKGLYVRCMRDN